MLESKKEMMKKIKSNPIKLIKKSKVKIQKQEINKRK